MRSILLCLMAITLGACAQSPDVKSYKDVSFGERSDQKLDIYEPIAASQAPRPVIVFFYGGAYMVGNKWQYGFAGKTLAEHGYIAVIPDYRKYPEVKFPSFVEDGAAAISWVADNIKDYGGDPSRIYVAGHSAGAHIGALLAADPRYLSAHKKKRSIIRAFAGLAGPYAFTPTEKKYVEIFGPSVNYDDMRVPNFIDGKQPPMLLMMGDTDKFVTRPNLDDLKAALDQRGGCASVKIYPKTGHIALLRDLVDSKSNQAPVVKDMLTFFENPCGKS